MARNPESPRTIRIFLASPSDVEAERDALSAFIQETNDVLAFLVPDRALRLELVRYETHTYPDIGRGPQDVINRQIPIDYDIFVGVMWKRAGTPTATSHHARLRPILMHCCDDQGRPMLGPQPRKDGEPGDLSNAHLGIPATVEALRQYWMPIRYKRAR